MFESFEENTDEIIDNSIEDVFIDEDDKVLMIYCHNKEYFFYNGGLIDKVDLPPNLKQFVSLM